MLNISALPYLRRIQGALARSQTSKCRNNLDQERVIEPAFIQAANRQTMRQQVAEETVEQFTIKKTIKGAVITLEGTYQGKPIRVRIFGEPVAEPIPERK